MSASIHRRRVSLVLVLVALAIGCHNKKESTRPTRLLSPLKSYDSLQDAQKSLRLKSGEWEVLEDRRPLTSDTRPAFRIYTIATPYYHHGVQGRLVLHFYNDRLMRTQFFPQNMDEYRAALARGDSINFNDQQESFIDPATKVWIGKEANGAVYVGWVDKNLKAEMDDWIKKYS